jgi:hypothetical protein
MRIRRLAGLAAAGAYLGLLAQATAGGAQCPASELGPCARVHQLMVRARPPAAPMAAAPMRGDEGPPRVAGVAVPLRS